MTHSSDDIFDKMVSFNAYEPDAVFNLLKLNIGFLNFCVVQMVTALKRNHANRSGCIVEGHSHWAIFPLCPNTQNHNDAQNY